MLDVAKIVPISQGEDPQVQAARIVAAGHFAVADAIITATDRLGPAADIVAGFGHRMDALCMFLRKKGPWLLATIPPVLTTVGAITPEAAKAFHAFLVALGAGV